MERDTLTDRKTQTQTDKLIKEQKVGRERQMSDCKATPKSPEDPD